MYLLKYLAQCGICSRRKAAELIKQGEITVNGNVVTMPFVLIEPGDEVIYQGKLVVRPKQVYILLNKPKDYLTTCCDERGRKTVMELVQDATDERVYPVGRLDRMTTGLLLLTNDGSLAQKLSHPRYNIPKKYRVLLDAPFAEQDRKKLREGLELDDGAVMVDAIEYGDKKNKCDVIVQLHSGRNRIVRRIFSALGYTVEKLDRIAYAGLTLGALPRGSWRFLTKQEVDRLFAL